MTKGRSACVSALLIFSVFCSLVTLSELPLISQEKVVTFAILKFGIVSTAPVYAFLIWKNVYTRQAVIMVGITMLAYTIVGQLYRPLYYLAYFQCAFLYAVVFPVSRLTFRFIMGTGAVLFLWILHSHWDQYVEQSQHPVFSDMSFAVASVALIAMIANTFFSSERTFHEDAVARFSQIGMHSARVIHDLKGLIGTPRLHIQFLQSLTASSPLDLEIQKILEYISDDLDKLKQILVDLNTLSTQQASETDWITLDSIVKSVENLLSKQLLGVELRVLGSVTLYTDRLIVTSILVNLILNSVQTFNDRKIGAPKIEIIAAKTGILVCDNAGGFDPKIIHSVQQKSFFSTREEGSGLGLMLTALSMKDLKGKMLLSNTFEGAQVELQFPVKALRDHGELECTTFNNFSS